MNKQIVLSAVLCGTLMAQNISASINVIKHYESSNSDYVPHDVKVNLLKMASINNAARAWKEFELAKKILMPESSVQSFINDLSFALVVYFKSSGTPLNKAFSAACSVLIERGLTMAGVCEEAYNHFQASCEYERISIMYQKHFVEGTFPEGDWIQKEFHDRNPVDPSKPLPYDYSVDISIVPKEYLKAIEESAQFDLIYEDTGFWLKKTEEEKRVEKAIKAISWEYFLRGRKITKELEELTSVSIITNDEELREYICVLGKVEVMLMEQVDRYLTLVKSTPDLPFNSKKVISCLEEILTLDYFSRRRESLFTTISNNLTFSGINYDERTIVVAREYTSIVQSYKNHVTYLMNRINWYQEDYIK